MDKLTNYIYAAILTARIVEATSPVSLTPEEQEHVDRTVAHAAARKIRLDGEL